MTTETNTQNEDEFASAFAELANLGDGNAPKLPATEQGGGAPAPAADGAAVNDDLAAPIEAAAEDENAGADEGSSDEAAAEDRGAGAPAPEGEGAGAPRAADDDVVGKLADRLRDVLTREPARPETPAQPQPRAEDQAPALSAEETQLLNTYVNDYPDVARAERIIRQQEYKQLLTHVFKEVASQLFPVAQQVALLANRTHVSDLHEMEPDYNDNLRQQVVDWVGTQPAYLRPAYEHVIKQGSPEEIVDLIRRYRAETGAAAPQAKSAANPASAPKTEPELPAAAKQAVAKLAPVGSKRSVVSASSAPATYEDAFKQAAAMLET